MNTLKGTRQGGANIQRWLWQRLKHVLNLRISACLHDHWLGKMSLPRVKSLPGQKTKCVVCNTEAASTLQTLSISFCGKENKSTAITRVWKFVLHNLLSGSFKTFIFAKENSNLF